MDNQITKLKTEYDNITEELTRAADPAKIKSLTRRHVELTRILSKATELETAKNQLKENEKILTESKDEELKLLAQEEVEKLRGLLPKLNQELKKLLIPQDPADNGDAILEIRAGTGGEEAGLFGAELLRMYTRFAERQNWKVSLDDISRSDAGGIKEAVLEIKGPGAYGLLKYEGGVHRVQRVPETEKSGRVHTSTASVAVLPLIPEEEFKIDPKEIKIETSTARGHGGQSVNTTYSAIRATHLPTGITAQSQDQRSQHQNREKALRVLHARVAAHYTETKHQSVRDVRRSQIKDAERSDKVRTYNFPQDRITDHRINQNFSQIPSRLDGDIGPIIDQLKELDEKEKLEALEAKN